MTIRLTSSSVISSRELSYSPVVYGLAQLSLIPFVITFLHRTAPKVQVVITRRQCLDVNLRSARREVKVADQIDIPPSDGRRAPENLDRLRVIGCELLLVHP
jgi:hypothetical protein